MAELTFCQMNEIYSVLAFDGSLSFSTNLTLHYESDYFKLTHKRFPLGFPPPPHMMSKLHLVNNFHNFLQPAKTEELRRNSICVAI